MKEIWKPIDGYEGLYTINSFGTVKNAKEKEKIPFVTTDGYFRVTLSKNGKRRHHLVHRLVAIAFVPNPENWPIINHKDENKQNNSADNLEWCSYKYNINYGNHNQNRGAGRKVLQFKFDGEFVASYRSTREAERITGICSSNIGLCCKGSSRYKHAGGFKWKYADE